MKKALVVFSGGQDSTTCLGWAKNNFDYVETITFDYGQKHKIEIVQAAQIAELLNVKNALLNINAFTQLNDSALINEDLDISSTHKIKTNLPSSFVPNRNAIFFTLAHAFAQKLEINNVIIGVNQTDIAGYPDCREEFVLNMEKTLNVGSESNIKFHYPLIALTKAETFKMSEKENVLDIVLDYSHTCYNGNHTTKFDWGYGCGECPSCLIRESGWLEYLQ
ncbi:MAG: 7-cyano-7-deazaguanine synthase QueC [Halarcobacter sp.]